MTDLESPELYMYNLKIHKIWFISLFLWLDSKKLKMALWGVKLGIINLCLHSENSCFQRFWITKQSKKSELMFHLLIYKKEDSGVANFLKWYNILFRYKTLLIILYWNILVKVSAITFRDIKNISFQFKVVLKKDSKYICDAGLELTQQFCIAYNSLLFNLLIT